LTGCTAVAAEVRESLAIIRVQMHRRMKGEASEVGSALLGAPGIWRCSAQGVQCLRLCGAEYIQRPRIAGCRRKPRAEQRLETRNDAAELLRRGVDSYRVQRLMRHSDVRVTLGTYAHLLVEDLRAAADAYTPLPATRAARAAAVNSAPIEPHAVQQDGATSIDAGRILEGDPLSGMERETGVEPATLSLGS
jgi:hypothetical protein